MTVCGAELAGFAPQDDGISIDSFTNHWTTLNGFNQSLPTLAQTLADSISDRREADTGPAGLEFVFDGVKTSVKGQYGQSSAPYKSISGKKWERADPSREPLKLESENLKRKSERFQPSQPLKSSLACQHDGPKTPA